MAFLVFIPITIFQLLDPGYNLSFITIKRHAQILPKLPHFNSLPKNHSISISEAILKMEPIVPSSNKLHASSIGLILGFILLDFFPLYLKHWLHLISSGQPSRMRSIANSIFFFNLAEPILIHPGLTPRPIPDPRYEGSRKTPRPEPRTRSQS